MVIVTATIVNGGDEGVDYVQNFNITVIRLVTDVEIENCPENGILHVGETRQLTVKVTPDDATNKAIIWNSSNFNTAKVDETGKVTAIETGATIITATSADGRVIAECFITVIQPVTSITLNKTTLTLQVTASETLTATIFPENASIKTVTWESDDTTIATVDDNGTVTGVKVGTATITVTTDDGELTATCEVEVVAAFVTPTGIAVTPTTLTIDKGTKEQLTVTLTPTGANPEVTWTSSAPAIVEVDETGEITAKAAGKATITAKTINGISATCAVTVVVPVEKVVIEPAECTIPLKGVKVLKATVLPADATVKTITWSSSDISVATVNATGMVTAKTINDDIEIYATAANGVVGVCSVKVGSGKTIAATESLSDITVYPNPTSGQLTIDNGELTMDNGACPIVEIYDVMGRRVNNCQLSTVNSQLKIDVSILPTGVYFIRIGNKTVKFVKQ
jgi:uncharacterized protein YjdB